MSNSLFNLNVTRRIHKLSPSGIREQLLTHQRRSANLAVTALNLKYYPTGFKLLCWKVVHGVQRVYAMLLNLLHISNSGTSQSVAIAVAEDAQ